MEKNISSWRFSNCFSFVKKKKKKVLLKLTSGKTLALNEVLYMPNIRANLISVALLEKVGVKVSFESDKIVNDKEQYVCGEKLL